jgi:hypothetical protein
MSISDKRLRKNQIPFQGKWFSNYVGTGTGSQLANGIADGDLALFASGQTSQIRIARPMKGDLTQARLSINAVAPDVGVIQFGIYIGSFDTDGVTPKVLTLQEQLRRHKLLTGQSDWISYGNQANIYWDGFNIFPFIPKKGDPEYNEDAFIIGIVNEIKNTPATPFFLFEFKVDCAVQMAEVQA